MATFISLCTFTDQGIRNVKESPKRAEAFKAMATKMGVTVKDICWTVGAFDMVVVAEGTEEAVTSALLKVATLGNVRSQTLRAYNASEFSKFLANV
jgi:uncharacterized protein with GYD domain